MNNSPPLVSVIALCYQHASFLEEALLSVKKQTYSAIELIIVDDASTDNSPILLQLWKERYADDIVILHKENKGNCASFNEAFRLAKGKYIVDFATDDLMHPQRIAKQVKHLEGLGSNWGVSYTDVWLIDEQGNPLKTFYPRHHERLRYFAPSDNIYQYVIGKQIISSPSMMIRRDVLEFLNGYDEALAYEDYDFWVRSAPYFKYAFLPEILTYKRILSRSHRRGFYCLDNTSYLLSTLSVCHKAYKQNKTPQENLSLAQTVGYYYKIATLTAKFNIATDFYELLVLLTNPNRYQKWLFWVVKKRINLFFLYKWLQKIKK